MSTPLVYQRIAHRNEDFLIGVAAILYSSTQQRISYFYSEFQWRIQKLLVGRDAGNLLPSRFIWRHFIFALFHI